MASLEELAMSSVDDSLRIKGDEEVARVVREAQKLHEKMLTKQSEERKNFETERKKANCPARRPAD